MAAKNSFVLLINSNAEGAMYFAERMRKKIEALTVTYDDQNIKFTISLGIAELNNNIKSSNHWIECADRALYESKHAGRNQSTIYTSALKDE